MTSWPALIPVLVIGLSDEIDTSTKPGKRTYAFKSMMAEWYVDELRERTLRGLEGRALAGFATRASPSAIAPSPRSTPRGAEDSYGRRRQLAMYEGDNVPMLIIILLLTVGYRMTSVVPARCALQSRKRFEAYGSDGLLGSSVRHSTSIGLRRLLPPY